MERIEDSIIVTGPNVLIHFYKRKKKKLKQIFDSHVSIQIKV